MPNIVWNTITSDETTISSLLTNGKMDFNKFIPMPEELRLTTSGGLVDELMAKYLLSVNKFGNKNECKNLFKKYSIHLIDVLNTKKATLASIDARLDGATKDIIREEFGNPNSKILREVTGKEYCEMQLKYGCHDWYHWANAHWDTKWNAFDQNIAYEMIGFCTAWCAPEAVFKAICKMYPDAEIDFEWEYNDENVINAHNEHGVFVSEEWG